jgi:hypothetical protein
MPTYLLEFTDGTLVDGIDYDLDRARDTALSVVQEEQRDVVIKQHFAGRSCVWEEYDVASYS